MKRFLSMAVAAGIVAVAASGGAQAVTIDFENVDTTHAPFGGLITDRDYVTQSGYYFEGLDPFNNESEPNFALVGAMINGGDPSTCLNDQCAAGNATNYIGSLNGSVLAFGKLNGGTTMLTSFDAAFLAWPDAMPTAMPAYLAIEADRADGSFAIGLFELGAIGRGGTTAFQNYQASDAQIAFGTGTLTSGAVTNLYAYVYYCGADGGCVRFQSNEGQFALDNIVLDDATAPVPEAATWAMMLAGFGGVGTALRRQKKGRPQAA